MTDEKDNSTTEKIPENLHEFFPEELKTLARNKTRINYLQGENIFKQGAFSPYVIYVVKGLVKVYLQTGYDKQINIGLAVAGDFLAFSAVFGENIHTYSTQALKDSEICMIEKESLKNILLNNPQFALEITTRNFKNERHLLGIIKNISYKQMRGKLASSLLYLSQPGFLQENIFNYLTRQDIADFASVSTESAIKFLKEFEKEEILKLKGRDIEIVNRHKLEVISKTG
jgi:CRP/FNR family transcriptional regulator